MKEKAPRPGFARHKEFARLARKVDAMRRQNQEPPQEILDRQKELDDWLIANRPGWVSNFPIAKESRH